MFTGIVLTTGKLVALEKKREPILTLEAELPSELKLGDSVAVNGACLTIVEMKGSSYVFNLSKETLGIATFNDLVKGSVLNLEPALRMNDFLGGHLVSGHLDGTARVRSITPGGDSTALRFTFQNREWRKFLIHKGSITINGVSLTVAEKSETSFRVDIIPHTLKSTNLHLLKPGERVNIELDLVGKYLYNFTLK